MTLTVTTQLALLAGMFLPAADAKDGKDAKADLEKLQGKWTCTAREDNGREWPEAELKDMHLAIDGEKITLTFRPPGAKDDVVQKGVLKLDASAEPKKLSFKWDDGGEYNGIYAFDGEALKACVTVESGQPAPKEFSGKAGAKAALMTFKKAK